MNSDKLRGRIVEKFHTGERFAEALGVNRQSVYDKLNGKRGMTRAEIERWCELLKIEREEIPSYFFTE